MAVKAVALAVSFKDVLDAERRLAGVAHRTPVLTSRTLDEQVGARVFLKCEGFQRAGTFKFRGAYNALSRLTDDEKRRGVLTYSSGNHAQATALAARLVGTSATIVMPKDAPAAKRRATEGYGARVVGYDAATENRETIARGLQGALPMVVIPPFDHRHVIAGQGTAALELFDEVGELDALVVPCGGGGLLAGSALVAARRSPACRVVGVEPELGDDGNRSFRSGTLQTVHNPRTIADGARTPSLGLLTFPIIRALVADMTIASDDELVATMRFVGERLKIVVEPTGVLGLAALMAGRVKGARVGVVLSGANVDLDALAPLLAASGSDPAR
jgi:threo-3-hydroxy-L-aspartate ammonia-lyase